METVLAMFKTPVGPLSLTGARLVPTALYRVESGLGRREGVPADAGLELRSEIAPCGSELSVGIADVGLGQVGAAPNNGTLSATSTQTQIATNSNKQILRSALVIPRRISLGFVSVPLDGCGRYAHNLNRAGAKADCFGGCFS